MAGASFWAWPNQPPPSHGCTPPRPPPLPPHPQTLLDLIVCVACALVCCSVPTGRERRGLLRRLLWGLGSLQRIFLDVWPNQLPLQGPLGRCDTLPLGSSPNFIEPSRVFPFPSLVPLLLPIRWLAHCLTFRPDLAVCLLLISCAAPPPPPSCTFPVDCSRLGCAHCSWSGCELGTGACHGRGKARLVVTALTRPAIPTRQRPRGRAVYCQRASSKGRGHVTGTPRSRVRVQFGAPSLAVVLLWGCSAMPLFPLRPRPCPG